MKANIVRRPGTPILIGIGAFVVLALLIVLALANVNVRTYEAGTPEAVAQSYIQALFDDDPEAAHQYLSQELQAKCQPEDLDMWWARSSDSASFEKVTVEGDHAEIELTLKSQNYDLGLFPFDNYNYSDETELELDRIEGEWVITNATWPLAGCTWR